MYFFKHIFDMTLLVYLLLNTFQGVWSVTITRFHVPSTIKGGSNSSVVLDCDFSYSDFEKYQLLLKWYFNEELVYSWQPPFTKPKASGTLKERINVDYEASSDMFTKHHALQIIGPTPDISGVYKCSIWDIKYNFEEEVMQQKMIVIDHNCTLPELIQTDEQTVVFPDDNFEIECRSQQPIFWITPTTLNSSSPRLTIKTDTSNTTGYPFLSTLQVRNTSYMDTGYYGCSCNGSADVEDYTRVSRHYLYVNDSYNLLVINNNTNDIWVIEGQEVIIPCRPSSPDIEVKLTDEDNDTVSSYRAPFNPREGFRMRSVKWYLHGSFFCTASRGDVVVTTTYNLNVQTKPRVILFGYQEFFKLQDTYLVGCSSYGNPKPKNITWFFQNCTLDKCKEEHTVIPSKNQHLILKSISLQSFVITKALNNGNLTCEACNDLGCDNHTIPIIVIDEFSVTGPDTIVEGDDVVLRCSFSRHNQNDSTYWESMTSSGYIWYNSTDQESTETTYYNFLHLPNISRNLTGVYWCLTRRKNGDRYEKKNFHIDVKEIQPPKIISTNLQNSELVLHLGEQVHFYCFINGTPQPTVTWYKDDLPIKGVYAMQQIKLTEDDQMISIDVTTEDSIGNYSCRVHNKGGTISKFTYMDFEGMEEEDKHPLVALIIGITVLSILLIILSVFVGVLVVKLRNESHQITPTAPSVLGFQDIPAQDEEEDSMLIGKVDGTSYRWMKSSVE